MWNTLKLNKIMIKMIKSLTLTIVPAIGGVAIVVGELDDSPGLGGLGLIAIGLSFYLNIKNSK